MSVKAGTGIFLSIYNLRRVSRELRNPKNWGVSFKSGRRECRSAEWLRCLWYFPVSSHLPQERKPMTSHKFPKWSARVAWSPKPDTPLFQLVGTSPFLSTAETSQPKTKKIADVMWTEPHGNLPIFAYSSWGCPNSPTHITAWPQEYEQKLSTGHSYCLCGQHLAPVLDSPWSIQTILKMLPSEVTRRLKTRLPTSHPTLSPHSLIEWKWREVWADVLFWKRLS